MEAVKQRRQCATSLARILGLGATLLAACGSSDQEEVVVGSGKVVEQQHEVAVVAELRISLPFDTLVSRGEAGQLTLRGEDNLLEHVVMRERDVSAWEIVAPADLAFEQHEDVEIEVPFIDMVRVTYSPSIRFAQNPAELLLEKTN